LHSRLRLVRRAAADSNGSASAIRSTPAMIFARADFVNVMTHAHCDDLAVIEPSAASLG